MTNDNTRYFTRSTKGFVVTATVTGANPASFFAMEQGGSARSISIPAECVGSKGLEIDATVRLMVHENQNRFAVTNLTATAVKSVIKVARPTLSGVVRELRLSEKGSFVQFAFLSCKDAEGKSATVFIPGHLVPDNLYEGGKCTVNYRETEKGLAATRVYDVQAPVRPAPKPSATKPKKVVKQAIKPAVEKTPDPVEEVTIDRGLVTRWIGDYGFVQSGTERIFVCKELMQHPKVLAAAIKIGDELSLVAERGKRGLRAIELVRIFRQGGNPAADMAKAA